MTDLLISIKVQGGDKAEDTFKSISDAAKTASSSVDSFQKQVKEIKQPKNLNSYVTELDKVDKKLQTTTKETKTLSKNTEKLSGVFKTIKAAAIGYATVLATMEIQNFIRNTIQATVELDALRRSFKAITGDMNSANMELDFISNTATVLGLELTTLEKSFRDILAASKNTSLEGQGVRDVFLSISKASSVLGMTTDQTEGALRALSQMISKGNVQAEELRGQLGERLPGAFQMAAEAMGVSTQKLNDMLENGEVLAEELLPKLADVLEKRFGKAAIESAESVQASFNRLTNTITELERGVGESGLIDNMKSLADSAREFLEVNQELIVGELSFFFNSVTTAAEGSLNKLNQIASVLRFIGKFGDVMAEVVEGPTDPIAVAASNIKRLNFELVDLKNSRSFAQNAEEAKKIDDEIQSIEESIKRWELTLNSVKETAKDIVVDLSKIPKLVKPAELEFAPGNVTESLKQQEAYNRASEFLRKQRLDDISKEQEKELKDLNNLYAVRLAEVNKALTTESQIYKDLITQRDKDRASIEAKFAKKRQDIIDKAIKEREKAEEKKIKAVDKALEEEFDLIDDFQKEVIKGQEKFQKEYQKITLSDLDYKLYLLEEEKKKWEEVESDKTKISEWYTKKRQDIVEEASEKERKIQEEAYDEVYKHAKDFSDEIIDNWDNLGDTLVDMAAKMVKDIAATFLAQNIVMPVMLSVGGALGLQTSGGVPYSSIGGMQQTGGLFSSFSNLSSGYNLLTGGISQSVGNFLGSGIPNQIGSSIFGGAWGSMGGGLAQVSAAGIPVGVASPSSLAAASVYGPTAPSGIVGGLSAAAPWAIGGSLGYSLLGGALGLPQSEWSGLTSGVGAGGGFLLGSNIGALGAAGGPIGAIAGALLGGIAGGLLGSDEPEPRIGIRKGDISSFGFNPTTQDVGGEREIKDYITAYYETYFNKIDEITANSVSDVLRDTDWERLRVHPDDYDSIEEAVFDLNDTVFKKFSEGFISGVGDGQLGGLLDVDFFENIRTENESLLDTFIRFGSVLQTTDGFVDQFTEQINDFGVSAEQAFANVGIITDTMMQVDSSIAAISSVDNITNIELLESSWNSMISVLENVNATTEQVTQTTTAMNQVIGANVSGLSATSLQSSLLGGGNVESIVSQQIANIYSGYAAEEISETYITGFNEAIGELFVSLEDNAGDFSTIIGKLPELYTQYFGEDFISDWNTALSEIEGLLSTETSNIVEEVIEPIVEDFSEEISAFNFNIQDIIDKNTLSDYQYELLQLNQWYEEQITTANELGISVDKVNQAYQIQFDILQREQVLSNLNNQLSDLQSELKIYTDLQSAQEQQLITARNNRISSLENTVSSIENVISKAEDLADVFKDFSGDISDLKQSLFVETSARTTGLSVMQGGFSNLYQTALTGNQQAIEEFIGSTDEIVEAAKTTIADPDKFNSFIISTLQKLSNVQEVSEQQSEKQEDIIDSNKDRLNSLNYQIKQLNSLNNNLTSINDTASAYYEAQLNIQKSGYDNIISKLQEQIDSINEQIDAVSTTSYDVTVDLDSLSADTTGVNVDTIVPLTTNTTSNNNEVVKLLETMIQLLKTESKKTGNIKNILDRVNQGQTYLNVKAVS